MLRYQEPQTQRSGQVYDWRCFCFKVRVRPLAQGLLRQLCLYPGAEGRVNVLLYLPRRKRTFARQRLKEGLSPEDGSRAPLQTPALWPLSSPLFLYIRMKNEALRNCLKCKF